MSMFWGLVLKPNRKYSQTSGKSFHISSIAIDKGEEAKLYLTAEQQKYTVATVNKAIPQVQLDLNFSKGDQIVFQTTGDAQVSLLGYMHDIDSEDENDDEFTIEQLAKAVKGNSKEAGLDEEDEEDSDDDDEDVDDSQLLKEYENGQEDDDDDDDDEDEEELNSDEEEEEDSDDEEESGEEEEVVEPKAKVAKISPNAKKQNGVSKNEQQKPQQQQKPAKGKKEAEPNKKDQVKQAGGERTISGGVKVADVVVGKGDEAKSGKRVSMYYIGRLQSNNKTFDSLLQGKGFKFQIGGGEVIKGWDVGVVGMKVGGKRRITCPPHMAYGGRGYPPKIPPNSTLVFDVELKAVH